MFQAKYGFPFQPKILAISLIGILNSLPAHADKAADIPSSEVIESSNIEALTVTGKRSADQKGADDVFYKNVSSVYAGREYLERYRTDAAGDVFKGLNGVYNMNTRNAGSAITPNIRGISGKGRIPVTIDGTEQTVDVWMNNYGIADRNYVDPALFRSITVEKGPAMTRGVKSGVGGAVSIRSGRQRRFNRRAGIGRRGSDRTRHRQMAVRQRRRRQSECGGKRERFGDHEDTGYGRRGGCRKFVCGCRAGRDGDRRGGEE